MITAIGAAAIARLQVNGAWNWLAAAFLTSVSGAWIYLTLFDLNRVSFIPNTALATTAIATLFTIEFAGRATRLFVRWRWSRLVYAFWLAVLTYGTWRLGEKGLTWSVYALNFAVTACAGTTLFVQRKRDPDVSPKWSTTLAVGLLLYSAFAGARRLLPIASSSDTWQLATQSCIALAAGTLAFAVFAQIAGYHSLRMPAKAFKAWRKRCYVFGFVLTSILTCSWFVASLTAKEKDAEMREQILIRTQLGASSIDRSLVEGLQWNASDAETENYQSLKASLASLQRSNRDLRFALLAGLDQTKAYFLADSERAESPDYSPPGQPYSEADAAYLSGMQRHEAFVLGPVTDRWGVWIIGSVPLIQLADGRSVNFELDVAAANWNAEIRRARVPVLWISGLIALIVLGFFQMQERLRETALQANLSEQRSRSLVEGSPDCVQLVDLSGRFQAVNRNGLAALGWPEANVLGRHFWEIWPAESVALMREAFRRSVEGESLSFEAEYKRPDHRQITWRVATNPIRDDAGLVCNVVVICVDLTDRKTAEEVLRAAKDAAEAATRAKSEFLAVMSHELRTPLSGVIGMLDLLRRSPPEAVRHKYTQVARDSAETLLRILDDILDMAKIEAGRLSLETIAFRPRDEFRSLAEVSKLRAETKGLDFEYSLHADVPEVLFGDPTRLRQIIGNLQSNAVKFTEEGKVSVSVHAIGIDDETVKLVVAVQDSGVGISEEHISRIFAKFEQADLSTTRRFGGTGLGLSIVKALADAMDGRIGIRSEVGVGTTFTFEASFRVGEKKDLTVDHGKPFVSRNPAERLRILGAEDDTVNRMVAEALLTRMGHEIEFVENGALAIERLSQQRYDLVLMDNRMPVLDGLQASRLIRSGTSTVLDPEVYICAATANVSESDRQRCYDHGMNDYVKKPLSERELSDALHRAVLHLNQRGMKPMLAEVAEPSAAPAGLSEADLLACLDEPAPSSPEVASAELFGETQKQLQQIFWQHAPARMQAMRDSFEQRDFEVLGHCAHALKSAAHYVGGIELSQLVAELETLSEDGDANKIAVVLAKTQIAYEDLRATALSAPTVSPLT